MELFLPRTYFGEKTTISPLKYDDGKQICWVAEDPDRGLYDTMTVEEILKIKIKHETAIPYGRYEVIMSFSNRFKVMLPLLLNVKGFDGIRMHGGNSGTDSSGCLLCAEDINMNDYTVYNCKPAMTMVKFIITKFGKTEKVFINIIKS